MPLIIAGRIVPLDGADPDAVFQGRVYLDDSGTIERVTAGQCGCARGFAAARSWMSATPSCSRPYRPAQSHRLQHAAAVDRAETEDAIRSPRQLDPRGQLPVFDQLARPCPGAGRAGSAPGVRSAARTGRRHDGHPGLAERQSRARAGAAQYRRRDRGRHATTI